VEATCHLAWVAWLRRARSAAAMAQRPGTGEAFDEKIVGADARADAAVGDASAPSTYLYTRSIFLRAVSLAFLAAFASLFVQVQGLLGSDGLSPAWEVADDALQGRQSPATFVALLAGSHMPLVDAWLDIMCIAGMAVAALGLAGYATMLSMFVSWLLYLSLCSVGGTWLEGKWDMLLLETGFVAMLWAPLWLGSSTRPPSCVALLLIRFVLFKLLLMQALSKLEDGPKGDDWRALTALETRYATDNIPTPTVYYYHYIPSAFFQLTAAYILTVEIVGSFYVLTPITLARHWTAGFIAVLPVLDMLSGNYGFYPLLVFCLTIPLFEDSFWVSVLRLDEAEAVGAPVNLAPSPSGPGEADMRKESTPLLSLPRASAYGTGAAAGNLWEEGSDEENAHCDTGEGRDALLDQIDSSHGALSGYISLLSIYVSINPSILLSIYLSINPSICLSTYLPTYQYICFLTLCPCRGFAAPCCPPHSTRCMKEYSRCKYRPRARPHTHIHTRARASMPPCLTTSTPTSGSPTLNPKP